MLATIKAARLLHAVPDDPDSAVIAGRCERMNGALEAVVGMRLAVHRDLKGLVVVVAAGFTCSHDVAFADMPQMLILKSANGIRFQQQRVLNVDRSLRHGTETMTLEAADPNGPRSEEHTSELQSPCNLVCRLLLEKKKKKHSPGEEHDEMKHEIYGALAESDE